LQAVMEAVESYFEDLKKGCNNLITCDQLTELMENKKDVYILDIRAPEDFENGHLDGSVNIAWNDVGDHLDELPKDQKVVVVCYSGQSAGQVVSLLKILGYNVCALKGGMTCDLTHLPIEAGCCAPDSDTCDT